MTILRRDALEILIPGKTHILERNGKEAYVYFEQNGSAHMLLDDGETRSGHWQLSDDGYVTEWDTGATGDWVLHHEEGGIVYVGRQSGNRLRMIGVLFGNAKELPRQAG